MAKTGGELDHTWPDSRLAPSLCVLQHFAKFFPTPRWAWRATGNSPIGPIEELNRSYVGQPTAAVRSQLHLSSCS